MSDPIHNFARKLKELSLFDVPNKTKALRVKEHFATTNPRKKSFNLQDNADIMATKSPGLETETI